MDPFVLSGGSLGDCEPQPVKNRGDLPTIQSCLKTWRQLDGIFRFILNDDGAMLAGEEKFFQPDVAGSDFTRIGSRIRPVDRRFIGRFDHLLRSRTWGAELIPRITGDGHWICQAVPFAREPETSESSNIRHRVALTIRGTGGGALGRWAHLGTVFHLTEAEQRVLKLMISGESVPIIAGQENLSVNTVRTHVRHIHEKLAISDAYELWARVFDYRLS